MQKQTTFVQKHVPTVPKHAPIIQKQIAIVQKQLPSTLLYQSFMEILTTYAQKWSTFRPKPVLHVNFTLNEP